jgi:hypothetical protein
MKLTPFLFIGLLLVRAAGAAIPATAVWELNASSTAANVNGGGFDPGDTANMATDLVCATATGNTTTCTSASYTFVAGDAVTPANWLYIKSDANFGASGTTGCWWSITSVSSGTATLNTTAGAGVCTYSGVGFPSPKYTANAVAGAGTTANPTGGTWSLDYSQTTIANNATTTDLASTVGTTNPCVVTSASYTFGVNNVGNFIHVTAGTNWTADWYVVVSVSAGAATLDKACGSAASLSSGTWRIGGAIPLGSATLDDAFFEKGIAGNKFFIKNGSYAMGQNISIAANGTSQNPIVISGYNSIRGDMPTGSTRPIINATASFAFTPGTFWDIYSVQFIGGSTVVLNESGSNKVIYVKVTNQSTTAARVAITAANNAYHFGCEAVSYRGIAFSASSNTTVIQNSYIHDSDIGVSGSSTGATYLLSGNIFAANVSNAYKGTGAFAGVGIFDRNTFYGYETPTGTGITFAAGSTLMRVTNNIIYGFTTGITHADSGQLGGYGNWNDFYNNTTDRNSGWQTGADSLALNPSFTGLAQLANLGTVTSSTNVLTDSGADFSSIVNDQDFIYILAGGTGTGFTAGIYPIHSHTSTTLTLATPANAALNITSSGAGSNISYRIVTGRNFVIGTNLKAVGYPGIFPGGLTTSYQDIGAVQRQETGTSNTIKAYTFQ